MRSTLQTLGGLILLLCCFWPHLAGAASDPVRDTQDQLCARYAAALPALQQEIDASLGARVDLIEEYLDKAHAMVYIAKAMANEDRTGIDESNADLMQLVELGYLESWPLNPLNNWEPMHVLTPAAPFSAGDLVLELCPASARTTVKGQARSMSFNLYVYGLEGAGYAPVTVYKLNQSWSNPPAGALNGSSYYMNSDKERAENKRLAAENKRQRESAAEKTAPAQPVQP